MNSQVVAEIDKPILAECLAVQRGRVQNEQNGVTKWRQVLNHDNSPSAPSELDNLILRMH